MNNDTIMRDWNGTNRFNDACHIVLIDYSADNTHGRFVINRTDMRSRDTDDGIGDF